MNLYDKYKTLFEKYEVNTPLRISHFMCQAEHESRFKLVRESLYYNSIDRLKAIFYTPFKGKTDSFVRQYLRNSEMCANYVYANRMGNGDQYSGDGFKFRGGGWFQNTGRNMYAWLKKETGIDFVVNPDLIIEEPNAVLCALLFWKEHNLNKYADLDDLDSVSDIINMGRLTSKEGDSNGYADRLAKLNKWKTILNYKNIKS